MTVPMSWLPPVKMERIICHWTAGGHKANSTDKRHYHILVEGKGNLVRGNPSIALNVRPAKRGYAAHTYRGNSGSIGVSLCCMANAIESPFKPGRYPMKKLQWDRLVEVNAALCKRYGIPVTPETVLSHAEVQDNLGIRQRGKWDYTRLPFDESIHGARNIGDRLRFEVANTLKSDRVLVSEKPTPVSDDNARPLGTVGAVSFLNMRKQPGVGSEIVGKLSTGDKVEINRSEMVGDTEWLSVIVMDDRKWAWVAAAYIDRD